jgi:hypothetical protein
LFKIEYERVLNLDTEDNKDINQKIKTNEFIILMKKLARAWSEQDLEAALACFTENAIYMEPPDIQLYLGQEQLRAYFGALKPGTFMQFHNIWFDELKQIGAGEYSFGMENSEKADHGIAVVSIQEGRMAFWREYQQKGPLSFEKFVSWEDKAWQWHIGNYP